MHTLVSLSSLEHVLKAANKTKKKYSNYGKLAACEFTLWKSFLRILNKNNLRITSEVIFLFLFRLSFHFCSAHCALISLNVPKGGR